MKTCASSAALLARLLLCGCSDKPPKNHAKREYPSAEAMSKWTDFSGDYAVERIKDGWTFFRIGIS
jgi:hypothetical protein